MSVNGARRAKKSSFGDFSEAGNHVKNVTLGDVEEFKGRRRV